MVVEADVQLLPAPGEPLAGVVFFPDDETAVDAVEAWRDAAPRMLEYMDEPSLGLLRGRFKEIPREAKAAIWWRRSRPGRLARPHRNLGRVDRIVMVRHFGCRPRRFRVFRHALPEAVNDIVRRNGVLKMNSDYAVPLERNREMLRYYRSRLEAEFPGHT